MFDCTPTLRRLAAVGTAVAATLAVPIAQAKHAPGEDPGATAPRQSLPGAASQGDSSTQWNASPLEIDRLGPKHVPLHHPKPAAPVDANRPGPTAAGTPASHSQATSPQLGEGLTGDDRVWLKPQPVPRHLGEGLTGADRSWLIPTTGGGQVALPSDGFDWTDAGIGAGTVVAALFLVTGSAVAIRRRYSPSH
jgi:hypothetical protein